MSQNKYMFSFIRGLKSWSMYSVGTNPTNYSRVNYVHRDDIYLNPTGFKLDGEGEHEYHVTKFCHNWTLAHSESGSGKRCVLPAVWMKSESGSLWAFSRFFHPTPALPALPAHTCSCRTINTRLKRGYLNFYLSKGSTFTRRRIIHFGNERREITGTELMRWRNCMSLLSAVKVRGVGQSLHTPQALRTRASSALNNRNAETKTSAQEKA